MGENKIVIGRDTEVNLGKPGAVYRVAEMYIFMVLPLFNYAINLSGVWPY